MFHFILSQSEDFQYAVEESVVHLNTNIKRASVVDNFLYCSWVQKYKKNDALEAKLAQSDISYTTASKKPTCTQQNAGLGIIDLAALQINVKNRPEPLYITSMLTGSSAHLKYIKKL